MSSFKNSWKQFLLSNPELDVSNKHILKIRDLCAPGTPFEGAFEIISKNSGISFISLDPMESSIQLFHHCQVIGGTWVSPTKTFVCILGFDNSARPIHIIPKSIKIIKTKSISLVDLVDDDQPIRNVEDLKQAKADFHWRNIIPIPNFLTMAYLSLEKFVPQSIGHSFYAAMREFDIKNSSETPQLHDNGSEPGLQEEENHGTTVATRYSSLDEDNASAYQGTKEASPKLLSRVTIFAHILQFCHLCHKKKGTPVLYSGGTTADMDCWFESVSAIGLNLPTSRSKRHNSVIHFESESDESLSSPDQKLSRKDQVFINTMLNYMI
jgi:hypothetical protein